MFTETADFYIRTSRKAGELSTPAFLSAVAQPTSPVGLVGDFCKSVSPETVRINFSKIRRFFGYSPGYRPKPPFPVRNVR